MMRTIQVKTTDKKGRRKVRKVIVETKEEQTWRSKQQIAKNADK